MIECAAKATVFCALVATFCGTSMGVESGSQELEYLRGLADELENFKGRLSNSIGGLEKRTQLQAEAITSLVTSGDIKPHDCKDVQDTGFNTSGIYTVYYKEGNAYSSVRVYCDMESDGGGWLVFQRRRDGHEDFQKTWAEYAQGFGDLDNEFWLGNYHIHKLTSGGAHSLRVDLADFDGNSKHAVYSHFGVGRSRDKFPLAVSGYTGNAGDGLKHHDGKRFSAVDKDFDDNEEADCADSYRGGWWYGSCHSSNVNGLYLRGAHESYANGVNWHHWHGYHYSLRLTEMKFRPVS